MFVQEVLEFLKENRVFYLATASAGQPHVRPMGFVMEHNGNLIFGTSNQKDMFKQLAENPLVEICAVAANYDTLRLCGKAVFCTSSELQKKAIETLPILAQMYAVGDGKFELFTLENMQAYCQSMSGEKKPLTV